MPTNVLVATDGGTCTEIYLKVMIYSPETGYKFDVTVHRTCFPTAWSIIFNLYKKIDKEFVQLVGVEFKAEKKEQQKAIADIRDNGVNMLQSRAFRTKVYPAVKELGDGDEPTEAERAKVDKEMSKAILLKLP